MRRSVTKVLPVVLAAWTMAACSDSDEGRDTTGERIRISGTVKLRSSAGQSLEPAADVLVEAWTVAASGQAAGQERIHTTTSQDGTYAVSVAVARDTTLAIRFTYEGYAPVVRTVRVRSPHDFHLDAILSELEVLACQGGRCRTDDGRLEIEGVAIASGYARAFNPAVEADQFPGPFADDQGNMLVSGVFAAFDLRDENDQPITDLGGERATIRLEIPVDTWAEIRDTNPGDGRITVPMYSFDEDRGTWVREGEGELEDDSGNPLSEEDIQALHDGSFAGRVFAVAQVSHFSWWNVDWPLEARSCVTGTVVDASGQPAAGAQVTIFPANYAGSSGPALTDEDGRFCLPVPRTEPEGEDLNGNGTAGEVYEFYVHVRWGGELYVFGPERTPSEAGTCPEGCADLGELRLDDSALVRPTLCHVMGVVTWATAQHPDAPLVDVYGWSESIDDTQVQDLCTANPCSQAAHVAPGETFALDVPILADLVLTASYNATDGMAQFVYGAERRFTACPTDPVTLRLRLDTCRVVMMVTWDPASQTISWEPSAEADAVMVSDALTGNVKWAIASETAPITSPVRYGQVPPGAQQVFPPAGAAPQPPRPGDGIVVQPTGGTIDYQGYACFATGQGVVQ